MLNKELYELNNDTIFDYEKNKNFPILVKDYGKQYYCGIDVSTDNIKENKTILTFIIVSKKDNSIETEFELCQPIRFQYYTEYIEILEKIKTFYNLDKLAIDGKFTR